jgi:hypothetical protein
MTIESIVILVLFIMLVFAVTYAFHIKRKAQDYTRERYAFAALAATINLVGIGVATVTSKKSFLFAIRELWSAVSGSPRPTAEPLTFAEQVLILIFIGFVIYIIHRTFVTWSGLFSAQDKRRQDIHEERLWAIDGLSELVRIFRGQPAPALYEPPARLREPPIRPPMETLAWQDNARDLFELRSRSYVFPEDGWHEMASAWVGRNGKTDATVGLYCVRELPSNESLIEFAAYVSKRPGFQRSTCELLVAIQDGAISEQRRLGDSVFVLMSESKLLEDLVDFSHYFREIARRVKGAALPDSDLKITDVYVEPSVVKEYSDARRPTSEISPSEIAKLRDLLDAWLVDPGQRHIALLGEYGQGKSTAALVFTFELSKQGISSNCRIPLLIELRGMSPSTLPPLQLLGAWCSAYRIDPRALMKLIAAGRAVIIFEGFDEMAEAGDPEARLNHFRALWKFAHRRNKMIITGRPNFFLDDAELKTALGVERASGAGAYCEAHYLKFFNFSEIEESLRSVKQETRSQIVELARNDRAFLDIVIRPSLLYIVAILWESEGLSKQSNLNSARVIELFTRHSYRRQSQKVQDGREFMILSPMEREYFMDGIAAYMVANNLNNQIQLDQLHEAVMKLFDLIPDNINLKQQATQLGPIKPLKERLRGRVQPIVDVEHDVRAYGILVLDYSRPGGAFRFAHKQFFEFIFARIVARRLLSVDVEECAAIVTATDTDISKIAGMPESLNFLGEIVAGGSRADRDPKELMESLFEAIVAKNKLRIPAAVGRLIIWEVAVYFRGSAQNRFRSMMEILTLKPSFVISLFISMLLAYYYYFGTIRLFGELPVILVWEVLLFVPLLVSSFALVALVRFRFQMALRLWFLVIDSMGYDEVAVANVYGNRAARLLALSISQDSLRGYISDSAGLVPADATVEPGPAGQQRVQD